MRRVASTSQNISHTLHLLSYNSIIGRTRAATAYGTTDTMSYNATAVLRNNINTLMYSKHSSGKVQSQHKPASTRGGGWIAAEIGSAAERLSGNSTSHELRFYL